MAINRPVPCTTTTTSLVLETREDEPEVWAKCEPMYWTKNAKVSALFSEKLDIARRLERTEIGELGHKWMTFNEG